MFALPFSRKHFYGVQGYAQAISLEAGKAEFTDPAQMAVVSYSKGH
jgi:hypothetical protein